MEEVKKRVSFCGGICQEWKRYNKQCCVCKKYLCKVCEVIYKKDIYCVNCITTNINIIKDVADEFLEVFK